jgi:hypothetical protein
MSVVSGEKKSVHREEEVKRRLKSKPRLPQMEVQRTPAPRMQPAPKPKTSIATATVKRQTPLKREIQLKPVEIKAVKPTFKELKEVVGVKSIKPTVLKATVQTTKEVELKAELKPQIPRIEARLPEISKPSKIGVLAKPPPKEELKVSLKPLKRVVLERIGIPVLRPPEIAVKHVSVVTPKPIGKEELTTGAVVEPVKPREELEFEPYSPDVFGLPEGLLDEKSEPLRGGLLGGVSPEGLVCIVADKTHGFNELVELLCSILFRIKGRGLPSVWSQGSPTETFMEFKMKMREDIVILEKVEEILRNAVSKAKNGVESLKLEDFAEQLKSLRLEQVFRFLILPVDKGDIATVAGILKNSRFEFRYHIPQLYVYLCKELDLDEWDLILRGMFGFIQPEPITVNVGHQCLELDRRFYERLRSIREEVKRRLPSQMQPKVGQELGQEESWSHYTLKFLVVKHLVDNLKVPEKFVKTEEGLDFTIPDIYVSQPKEIAVEIETFYGTGEPYNAKLIPKLEKYREAHFEGELWLVVPNIQALLYVDDLLKLRRDYRREKLNVEVYTLDLTGDGAELTCGEKRQAGLVRLVDLLKLFRDRGLKRHQKFLKISIV